MSFGKPKPGHVTEHLFVGNCGPSVGINRDVLTELFNGFGEARLIVPEQQRNPRSAYVFVSYIRQEDATAALGALDGKACASAGNRVLSVKYADLRRKQVYPPLLSQSAPSFC